MAMLFVIPVLLWTELVYVTQIRKSELTYGIHLSLHVHAENRAK